MTWIAILGCVAGALAVDALLDPDRRAAMVRWWRSRPSWEFTVEFTESRKGIAPKPDPLAIRPGLPSASDWADLHAALRPASGRNGGSGRRGGNVSGGERRDDSPKIACMRTSCEGAPLDDRYPRGWEPHPRSTDICMACYKRDGR